eukprot:TRINITY_DN8824_c0_g1_i1.p1 TRINITY_DN8824_c0_g1~~TRINITY_DN8824_c0_g1_i1.p1  ORF type:complete len:511 (+),score=114.62 TRINITY_DN8824_c0_g1_i1:87-1619(+)
MLHNALRRSLNFSKIVSKRAYALPYSAIPGPAVVNEQIGCYPEYEALGGFLNMTQTFKNLHAKYGDVVRVELFGKKDVNVFHPDLIEKVFANEGKYPLGATLVVWPLKSWFDLNVKEGGHQSALMTTSGETWRELRTKLQKNLFNPPDAHEYLSMFSDVIKKMVDSFPEWQKEQHSMSYALVSIELFQHILFNKPTGAFDDVPKNFDNNPSKNFIIEGIRSFELLDVLLFNPTSAQENLPKLYAALDVVKQHSLNLLKEQIEQLKNDPSTAPKSYLAHMISRGELTQDQLFANIIIFMFAAVDTTATTLEWLLYNLSKNPEVQTKLQEELDRVLQGGPLLKNHMNKVPYLKAVIKENFRVSPTVAATARILPEDLELNGYLIPAGTTVGLSAAPYHHSEKVFENPNEFDPSRWDREAKKARRQTGSTIESESNTPLSALRDHPYFITPFSIGPRMCIGARVAEAEIYAFLASLLQKYTVTLAPDSPTPRGVSKITLKAEPRPKFVYTKRN